MKLSRIIATIVCMCLFLPVMATSHTLQSPDKNLMAIVQTYPELSYELFFKGQRVTYSTPIEMTLINDISWNGSSKPLKVHTKKTRNVVKPLYGQTDKLLDNYNELTCSFAGYSVVFRLYDEGFAYRFIANGIAEDSIIIKTETAPFRLSDDMSVIFPETTTFTSWELTHKIFPSIAAIDTGRYGITPMLFGQENSFRVVVAEADLHNYPGMYLLKTSAGLEGYWAKYPKKVGMGSWGNFVTVVEQRENFLAKTAGNHLFPWRLLIVTDDDRRLLNNEMIFLLSEPCKLTDTKWIKPGKATWEWWHCAMLENAPFVSGHQNLSTQLYKYYIDFAAENNIEYLLIDAGWSNLFRPNELNPNVDVKELIRYATDKNVGVWLWTVASTLMKYPHRYLDSISSWNAAGIKIDFFDRDDGQIMEEYEKLAQACAERHLLVDFHGCSKPTGLQRTYPNILNFEAVRGAECAKWDTSPNPDYHLQFMFSRMLAGPLDYTPGSMRNATMDTFKPIDPGLPSTLGTRCHELAMYILFKQPFAMLCDSPDEYRKYPDILNYLATVPVNWNENHVLAAEVGKYAVMAKRKGNTWYVGAMNAWGERRLTVSLPFLRKGTNYTAEIFADTELSNTDANQYEHQKRIIRGGDSLTINMASGGGYVLIVRIND